MNKVLKWVLIVIGLLAVLLFAGFQYMKSSTKKASPEAIVQYQKDGKDIEVFYCRPSKKGRDIFGGLEPYGVVWRTGANEATTFETKDALQIGQHNLPAGKYTLWTIPNKERWTIIFNGKMYPWGMGWDQKVSREPEADVVKLDVPVQHLTTPVEQFTIAFEDEQELVMSLSWDDTRVEVPIN
ncbi:MAG: DUF2911 domain-containing protein [Saprospiraceae bacterium]|nr:DUF2911 domain-containing protein [Saprospiraceae bacterium]